MAPQTPPTPPSASTVRRPDTGCTATLGTGLVPAQITHTARCKCIPRQSPEKVARLASAAAHALEEGVLQSDKPAIDFAMMLLGAHVVFEFLSPMSRLAKVPSSYES
ncbi:hypothetical protein F5X98DRAFT_371901 [Xylaria grammica]|nr:hypothetical protein F5X98DRAFT_371901 [Xylaria grammica]